MAKPVIGLTYGSVRVTCRAKEPTRVRCEYHALGLPPVTSDLPVYEGGQPAPTGTRAHRLGVLGPPRRSDWTAR